MQILAYKTICLTNLSYFPMMINTIFNRFFSTTFVVLTSFYASTSQVINETKPGNWHNDTAFFVGLGSCQKSIDNYVNIAKDRALVSLSGSITSVITSNTTQQILETNNELFENYSEYTTIKTNTLLNDIIIDSTWENDVNYFMSVKLDKKKFIKSKREAFLHTTNLVEEYKKISEEFYNRGDITNSIDYLLKSIELLEKEIYKILIPSYIQSFSLEVLDIKNKIINIIDDVKLVFKINDKNIKRSNNVAQIFINAYSKNLDINFSSIPIQYKYSDTFSETIINYYQYQNDQINLIKIPLSRLKNGYNTISYRLDLEKMLESANINKNTSEAIINNVPLNTGTININIIPSSIKCKISSQDNTLNTFLSDLELKSENLIRLHGFNCIGNSSNEQDFDFQIIIDIICTNNYHKNNLNFVYLTANMNIIKTYDSANVYSKSFKGKGIMSDLNSAYYSAAESISNDILTCLNSYLYSMTNYP